MRRPVSPGWLFAPLSASLLALLSAGCGHEHPSASTEVDEYFYDCEDPKRPPALTVFATDESLRKLIEKEDAKAIVSKDEEAVTLTAPASGAALSASTPPTFLLSPPATGAQLDHGPAPARFTPTPAGAVDHRRELEAGRTHTAVEIQMDSDTRHREQLNDLLSELFLLTKLSEEEVGRIRYAVLEMIENAMEWGNRRRKELLVTISYQVTDEFVKFVITDQGSGFDPKSVPHAACEDDPVAHLCIREKLGLRDGGFGMLITKGIMDEVRYNETGNQVTLIKHLNGQAATA